MLTSYANLTLLLGHCRLPVVVGATKENSTELLDLKRPGINLSCKPTLLYHKMSNIFVLIYDYNKL